MQLTDVYKRQVQESVDACADAVHADDAFAQSDQCTEDVYKRQASCTSAGSKTGIRSVPVLL